MTARRNTPAEAAATDFLPGAGNVDVTIAAGTLVYFDGEQRGGTITDVPIAVAARWQRHGWTTAD